MERSAVFHRPSVRQLSGCDGNRGWSYFIPHGGRQCCEANSVGADRRGWFKAEVLRVRRDAEGLAELRFALFFKALGTAAAASSDDWTWQRIKWSNLGVMHGRRIHASVVTDGARYAWHEHPDGAHPGASDTEFIIRLRLPEASVPLRARVLFNFGLLADEHDVNV